MAMSIGDENKPGWIEAKHWHALADQAQIPVRLILTYLQRQTRDIESQAEKLLLRTEFLTDERNFLTTRVLPVIRQRVAYVASQFSF
ncbi:MAG: hypothetical protein ACC707_08295 [Thiohalomonadales bacterium]